MKIQVNGTRLWFDVEGSRLMPDGPEMRTRPTVLALHGGPGRFDHSYLRAGLSRLAAGAQVIYLDLRGHGRSDWGEPTGWTLEDCADDVRAFCDTLGIDRPVVFGHSLGGFVALLYAARHPGHAGGLALQATAARWDVPRFVERFRQAGGDEVAAIAERTFGGATPPPTLEEVVRCLGHFGPQVPDADMFARTVAHHELTGPGTDAMLKYDVVADLPRIDVPSLVSVGDLDPITPVAAAQEIADGLPDGRCDLEVFEGLGHFPWLDDPDRYWPHIEAFVEAAGD